MAPKKVPLYAGDFDDPPPWKTVKVPEREKEIKPVTKVEKVEALRAEIEKPRKRVTSIRYDPDVIDGFKKTGPGWQARMNAVLRKHLGI